MKKPKKKLCPSTQTLDPDQVKGAYYIAKTQGNIFLCDDMGKGKTVTAIAYMNLVKETKVLIIPKAKGVPVWKKHLKTWHLHNPKIVVYHPDSPEIFEADILIAHYHWLSYQECAREIRDHFFYNLCILDEPHTVRKISSQRAKFLFLKNGICKKAKKTIAVTGTPLFNRPIGMYPLLKGLRPDVIEGMNRHQFGMKYCGGFMDKDGTFNYNGASNIDQLARKMESVCMLRRKGEDNLLQWPRIGYIEKTKIGTSLDRVLGQVFDNNFKANKNPFTEEGVEIATLRRMVGEEKVEPIGYYIQGLALNPEQKTCKILLFVYHISVGRNLVEYLHDREGGCILNFIHGGSSSKYSEQAIDDFQNKNHRQILIATIGTLGDTVTLTKATHLIFGELSYIWEENFQAMKRVARRGRDKPVKPVFIIHRNSFDERILKINFDKLKTSMKFG